ncbi:hypothetical protein S40293_08277 [Stachybotrys chartarum IBT 40293]|nr:hypothetical protein S40293_08277 [Stachybotrys chartarum IBT 40293]
MSNIIAVVGATGNQGSSVANTFLSLPDWTVRCLTRSPSSPAALRLAAAGAHVVQADLDDVSSLERAFDGAAAVFSNTDFWAPYIKALAQGVPQQQAVEMARKTEVRQARNAAAAAAKQPSLKRFVYSALGPMDRASGGKYPHCGHWEAKAEAAEFMEREMPELQGKLSFFYPGAYHDNPILYPQQYEGVEGYAMMLPGYEIDHIPVIRASSRTGPCVRALIEDEEPGVKLEAYDCLVTAQEALDAWIKFTGKPARMMLVPYEEMHRITGIPYEVLDGPAFMGEFSFMDGVEGRVMQPRDLKKPLVEMSYMQMLEERGLEAVLATVPMTF